ncbi:MAG TPA: FAD-dependent oxidoreductase [Candidatus Bathyarchaeia archaeon]|nr:FAD-dependent oxidoreductase [Candidatus Bathyarchaeia archaeon]
MEIAIIGAGICGLTAGLYLSQRNQKVTVFEKEKFAGGLAASYQYKNWNWPLEYFPHHLFTSDHEACKLIGELKLNDRLFFVRPKTSIYLRERLFQFDSPFSILKAPIFSWTEKARIGSSTFHLKATSSWQKLEKQTAFTWTERYYGKRVSELLWQPLLKSKFGCDASKISMSWLWARIKKRSIKLGYLRGGFNILLNELINHIKSNGGRVILNTEVTSLDNIARNFDKVIVTCPTDIFLKITNDLPNNYRRALKKLHLVGALNLLLILKKSFLRDGSYWLNINEREFPFVFVDEHTNFIGTQFYGNHRLLYVGGYYPQNHRYFKMEKKLILKEFLPFLKRINPEFKFDTDIIDIICHKSLCAQPVVSVNYAEMIPDHVTPIPNVYLANLQQIYPWDRGLNYSIELGRKIAGLVLKENKES